MEERLTWTSPTIIPEASKQEMGKSFSEGCAGPGAGDRKFAVTLALLPSLFG